jgi:threonine dehydrogenase-like Zn-dependent dehydrogenase
VTTSTVNGLALTPGVSSDLKVISLALPSLGPNDVQIRVLEAGICGTDREIIHGQFGYPPAGESDLVLGHEALGQVTALGSQVHGLAVGDLVTATVRRACTCPNCLAGESDYCTLMEFTERGIRGAQGFWTDAYVENADFVIKVPDSLRKVGVMIEPASVIEKAWRVALAVQQRFPVWEPTTALVFGAGPIGILQAMLLRQNGMEVTVVARRPAAEAPATRVLEMIGARYVSNREVDIRTLGKSMPNIDVIIEASGDSGNVLLGMELLGNAGVLVLLSNTGGSEEIKVPMDRINVNFVGGNKTMVGSVNSSVADFQAAVRDMQVWEKQWPGALEQMITHRIAGLAAATDLMETTKGAIKAVIHIGGDVPTA